MAAELPLRGKRAVGLDALRIFACLIVVMYHLTFRGNSADSFLIPRFEWVSEVTRYGFLGVDLFFIISGYAIWASAQRKHAYDFALARAVRLLPAFWVCCTITYLSVHHPLHAVDFSTFMLNMTMLGGFLKVAPVDTSYWSLVVEMHFYFLVLLAIIAKVTHKGSTLAILWLLAAIGLLCYPVTLLNFLFVPYWAGLFIAGISLWHFWHEESKITSATSFILSASLSIHLLDERVTRLSTTLDSPINPGTSQILLALLFGLVFLATCIQRVKTSRSLVLAAGLTYPLYLLHQNLGYTLINLLNDSLGKWFALAICILILVVASASVHLLIEKPLQRKAKTLLGLKNEA